MNHDTTNTVVVQVIIPVHNAAATIVETVQSAMHQQYTDDADTATRMEIHVCCYDDGSTDESWDLLQSLLKENPCNDDDATNRIPATLHIQHDDTSRGAGVARNRAVAMYSSDDITPTELLCWLDADDIMRPTRVSEQAAYLLSHDEQTLLGCQFERDPPDATWHYTNWANHLLTDERLVLEQFREVTLIQPTWMMFKSRFWQLEGYIEPPLSSTDPLPEHPLVDATYETQQTLRLAEDLRFFHQHLQQAGRLKLLPRPLVVYRHTPGMSQSSYTPRKLLLRIRATCFSLAILRQAWCQQKFCIWGAGRDGKDFFKALAPELQAAVYCFVDVDDKKIMTIRKYGNIPIVHFSLLARDVETRNQLHQAWCQQDAVEGRMDKGRPVSTTTMSAAGPNSTDAPPPPMKKQRLDYAPDPKLNMTLMSQIPVVVCVAMYRTNGALERNVNSIGRTEGKDLWFFN